MLTVLINKTTNLSTRRDQFHAPLTGLALSDRSGEGSDVDRGGDMGQGAGKPHYDAIGATLVLLPLGSGLGGVRVIIII